MQGATALVQVDADGAGDANGIDAGMQVKAPVFGGDDRVLEMRADGVGGHDAAKLIAAPGKDLAPVIEKGDRAFGAAIHKSLVFGQA